MALIQAIGDNPLADAFSKECAEILVAAYPNHSWWVECKGGVLIIKHLEVSGRRGLLGMLRKMDTLSSHASRRKREIIQAAGELLERAALARGPRGDEPVVGFEVDDPELRKYWHRPAHMKLITDGL